MAAAPAPQLDHLFAALADPTRRAIVEILRDTRRDLPAYFRSTQVVMQR